MSIQDYNGQYNAEDAFELACALSLSESLSAKPKAHEEDEDGCTICLETWDDLKKLNEKIFTTNCGHTFCEKDIEAHAKKNTECPLCRREVTPKDIEIAKLAQKQLPKA